VTPLTADKGRDCPRAAEGGKAETYAHMMADLKGRRRAVGEYDWLNGWQRRKEKAERFDESRRDEVDRSPGIHKGFETGCELEIKESKNNHGTDFQAE